MIPYTHEQMQAIVDEIGKQTDRGAAIIAAAAIEDVLTHLIIARLVELPSKRKKALFDESNGPLSNLSSKIELGFALGLFNEERRESLHLIRKSATLLRTQWILLASGIRTYPKLWKQG
jgi:hypothetical protein